MKNKRNKKESVKLISYLEIVLLVVAIIAFSWAIGSEVKVVSAASDNCLVPCGTCVGEDAYWGCADSGICVSNGTLLLKCTDGMKCKGGVCLPEDSGGGGGDIIEELIRLLGDYAKGKSGEVIIQEIGKMLGKGGTAAGEAVAGGAATGGAVAGGTAGVSGATFNSAALSMGPHSLVLHALVNFAVAAAFVAGIYFGMQALGTGERNLGDILTVTSIAGAAAATGMSIWLAVIGGPLLFGGAVTAVVILAAFGAYMLSGYKIYSKEVISYKTSMWQLAPGENNCERCNSLTIGVGENKVSGCSEYICHTYGTACIWLNKKSDEGYEKCITGNPNDLAAPIITPALELNGKRVFSNEQYNYREGTSSVRIIYEGEGGGAAGCVPAYSPVTIAFTTNEEAICRIIYNSEEVGTPQGTPKEIFESMGLMDEGGSYVKNHSLRLSSRVTATTDALDYADYVLDNGGNYEFYVRCTDYWGNTNTNHYSFRFCVQQGPDRYPPKITKTIPETGDYVRAGVSVIEDFQIHTDEPVECRWDVRRVNYEYMNYEFERCSTNVDDYISGFNYGCRGNLTQFRSGEENIYYVACKDQPELKGTAKESQRNTADPYTVRLIGTRGLLIQSVRINERPNGTILRSPEPYMKINLNVFTASGAESGKAKCTYGINGAGHSLFYNGGSTEYLTSNKDEFTMESGFYKVDILCSDVVGNEVGTYVNFTIELDNIAPAIVRAFKESSSDSLKIITDEAAHCVYSTTSCVYKFEEGTPIRTTNGLEHYTSWDSSNDLYIKCADEFENAPLDGVCSIILRPFEVNYL